MYWTAAAEQDRAAIVDYIAQDNPIAAVRMDERFAEASARLAEQPFLGKTGWVSGTREE